MKSPDFHVVDVSRVMAGLAILAALMVGYKIPEAFALPRRRYRRRIRHGASDCKYVDTSEGRRFDSDSADIFEHIRLLF
jgi:hypothetical protein